MDFIEQKSAVQCQAEEHVDRLEHDGKYIVLPLELQKLLQV